MTSKNVFRYYGGKFRLANKIIKYIGSPKIFVEPFCGAANVFFKLNPTPPITVLNDKDDRVVNVYRVLQDKNKYEQLKHMLIYTPYSKSEFARALILLNSDSDEIRKAWALIVAANQGFAGKFETVGNWGRSFKMPMCSSWQSRLKYIDWWHNKLSKVNIDCKDAIDVIKYWDTIDTTFYVDPPYILDTRNKEKYGYFFECSNEYHEQLVDILLNIKGGFILSGYDHPIYDVLSKHCLKITIETVCHAAGKIRVSKLHGEGALINRVPRTEVLWINEQQKKLAGLLL